MTKEAVRDFYGNVIGYIETDKKGNKTVRDFYNTVLGYYKKADNTTRDFFGRVVARGDAAAMLLKGSKK